MLSVEDSTFLKWFINRLVFRYCIDPTELNFQKFNSLMEKLQGPQKINMSKEDLDKIISKYYADFYLDKAENMGFTEEERNKLRQQVIDLVHDVINEKIPKDSKHFIQN